MGAGARLAAERDRWPDHWRVADFEMEEEGLLALLAPSEELRAVVPGMRSTPAYGENQVLVGVTDRRVIVIGRRGSDSAAQLRVVDVTQCVGTSPRGQQRVPHDEGHLDFDLDDEALARIWARIDDLDHLASSCD
jgi:hypothetical protein